MYKKNVGIKSHFKKTKFFYNNYTVITVAVATVFTSANIKIIITIIQNICKMLYSITYHRDENQGFYITML